ncbi:MAG: Rab family GTPase [Chitinophagales bacterium]
MEQSKKIILAGGINAGKTSLVNRYVHQRFSEQYAANLGIRIARKEIHLNDEIHQLIIWDPPGDYSTENMPQSYLLGASGIIYVMDLSEPGTFAAAVKYLALLRGKLPNAEVLIAANKCDLFSENEIRELIKKMDPAPHFVCSAKENVMVEELFQKMAASIFNK